MLQILWDGPYVTKDMQQVVSTGDIVDSILAAVAKGEKLFAQIKAHFSALKNQMTRRTTND